MTDHELPPLDLYAVPGAPPGFAARVVAAATASPRPRAARWAAVAAAAAIALALAVALLQRGETSGSRTAGERATVALDGRGVAVLEAGAQLRWSIGSSGAAAIDQARGDVFYRVERGGRFQVRTAIGTVAVTGTSFRVQLQEDDVQRKTLGAGAAGAAIATALIVTVYEGRVLLANDRGQVAIGPGQTGTAAPGTAPRATGDHATAPTTAPIAATATTTQAPADLAHATARIAELEAKLREIEAERDFPPRDPARYYAPSQDTLRALAEKCWLAFDVPPFSADGEVELVTDEVAQKARLTPRERAQINDAYQDEVESRLADLRALYTELTGDTAGARTLSVEALGSEIKSKTPPGEELAARRRIARERAALDPRPGEGELAHRPVIERYLRLISTMGDRAEAAAAARIGADRARALRAIEGVGWHSSVSDYGGCDRDW